MVDGNCPLDKNILNMLPESSTKPASHMTEIAKRWSLQIVNRHRRDLRKPELSSGECERAVVSAILHGMTLDEGNTNQFLIELQKSEIFE